MWPGAHKAVQLQIYATLIFYAVLLTICQQVAQVLGEPLERISVEMVFRAFYHYSRAVQHGEAADLVQFLAEHAKLLGIVKRWRKHHRERQQREAIMWETLKLRPVGARGRGAGRTLPRAQTPPGSAAWPLGAGAAWQCGVRHRAPPLCARRDPAGLPSPGGGAFEPDSARPGELGRAETQGWALVRRLLPPGQRVWPERGPA